MHVFLKTAILKLATIAAAVLIATSLGRAQEAPSDALNAESPSPPTAQETPSESTDTAETPPEPAKPLTPFDTGEPVRIPNFWDPNSRPEKPDAPVRTIRFLTANGFPPFNFISADGRLSGFNIELARAICEVLEAECTVQMRPFAELATALAENRGDAIISGIAMTAENRKTLGFSDVYLRLPARFATRRDADFTAQPKRLSDKWVATVAGSAHEAFLHQFYRDSRIITYPSPQVARTALKAGEVDAYFGSGMSLSFWLASQEADGCCRFLGGPFLDPYYFGEGLSVAVARDNGALKKAVDYALHRVYENGRYEELYLRYFPVSFF